MHENRAELETPQIATQGEMLQLLAEVEKITVFGDNMGEWGETWGTTDYVDDLDNGHVGSATHKNNLDIPPVSCKFDMKALRPNGRRSIAQLSMDGHTYDFFIKTNHELSDEDYISGDSVSYALEEMWGCDELYSVTYDESGNQIPRDPNEPVHMPASKYNLSNIELLEVYVDLPQDHRKFMRGLGIGMEKFVKLLPD